MISEEPDMTRQIAITQEMIDLYDDYTHRTLNRRRFLEKLGCLAGGSAAAASIVPLLEANYAAAAIVPEDDPRLIALTVEFVAPGGSMAGYLARPLDADHKLPAVIVIHENRGLNPHIKDVARRVALAGFVALAPDFLAPDGGTPDDPDRARDMIRALDPKATVRNAVASFEYLSNSEVTTGKIGAVGFCWGGGLVNQLAVHEPHLAAAVSYYGQVPDSADVPKIKAKLLLHYAGLDKRINAGVPGFREALEGAGVDYTMYFYDGVNHAFNNDTAGARYDKNAADFAWQRTIDFLKESLE
jgi:carboxymethylenebutenolidase